MDTPMKFWGVEVKVGQSVKVDPNDQSPGYIHISQVALGEVKKDKATEPVVLYLKIGDREFVLGTLIKDEIPHIAMDIVLDDESELSHNSKNASVCFSGFKIVCGSDSDDDSDASDSEPELVPLMDRAQDAKEAAKSGTEDESDSDFSQSQIRIEFSETDTDDDSEESESEEETPAKKVEASAINAKIDTDTTDSDSDEETPAKKVEAPQASAPKNATHEKIDTDTSDTTDSSDEETPTKRVDQGKNGKRRHEAGSQTPVPSKKAKNATLEKTDDKKGVHIATPHPMKKGGKTPQSAAKGQTPSSNKSASSKIGQQNKKSKQDRC